MWQDPFWDFFPKEMKFQNQKGWDVKQWIKQGNK